MVVLDTDLLTLMQQDATTAKTTLSARLKETDPREITTTIITYEEQMRDWLTFKARARNSIQEIAAYAKLRRHIEYYRAISVVDFDDEAATEFERLRRLKIRIGTMDLKIAAIVLAKDATLLTRNLVDFRKAPGLKAEDWTTE